MKVLNYKNNVILVVPSKKYTITYIIVNYGKSERIYAAPLYLYTLIANMESNYMEEFVFSSIFTKIYGGVKPLYEIIEKFADDDIHKYVVFGVSKSDKLFIDDVSSMINRRVDLNKPLLYQILEKGI